ncbi:MAG: hypothetical protein P1Q69_03295 [Candidatus Thorarchaeota archaeon]|nr:hypothetical protein [Candidatus Thorarchaeota archaeon]
MKKKCKNCGKITEHSPTYGYCLECDENPAVVAIKRRTKQYIKWTGDTEWQYDAGEYWPLAFENMYHMAGNGYSASDIASEFDTSKSNIYSRIREYCKKENLETPFGKRKRSEKKSNGLFCLACNRPLVGNQRKWCSNEDCGGWNDLHPRIVRQCSICLNITETYIGSGYEETCKGCLSSIEEAKHRTAEWIKQQKELVQDRKKIRERAYREIRMDISTECEDDIFFGYLSVDFSRHIITPSGKQAEDMFEICRDIQKVWEICKPHFWLKHIDSPESYPLTCPAVSPALTGPYGISCLLAPIEEWQITLDLVSSYFSINGKLTTFLTMDFSNWLETQYLEHERNIPDISEDANTTIFRIEFALNNLSIPIRK